MRISLEEISGEGRYAAPHDYRVSRTAWRVGARMLDKMDVDSALAILDDRAERCIAKRDIGSARRWRDVMAVIHAIAAEQVQSGQGPH